nr:hypothetical protein [Kibdelosporangium sp. MJ126-NF4]
MATLEACVSKYSLTVDASETIDLMVQNADNPWGRRLRDALIQATSGRDACFAVSPYAALSHAEMDPRASDGLDLPDVGDASLCRVLSNLEAAGLIATRTVLHEAPSENYLTDGRIVTAVEVMRPFVLVTVRHSWSSGAWRSMYADRWEIAERSYIVPAGWYLVGEVGEHCYDLAGVAGMDGISDDTFCWLYDLEGFDASHCMAECDSCGSRWTADGGSWRFEPDWCDAPAWSFDDAEDFGPNETVGCPSCGTGRVYFQIS